MGPCVFVFYHFCHVLSNNLTGSSVSWITTLSRWNFTWYPFKPFCVPLQEYYSYSWPHYLNEKNLIIVIWNLAFLKKRILMNGFACAWGKPLYSQTNAGVQEKPRANLKQRQASSCAAPTKFVVRIRYQLGSRVRKSVGHSLERWVLCRPLRWQKKTTPGSV